MELFEQITANTTILTPNRRLSATLLKKYQTYQISKQKTGWPSLEIMPFTSWIEQLWSQFTAENIETTLILSSQQEQLIWESILQQSPITESLLQISGTAELAKSAWSLLKQWRVALDHSFLSMTEDSSTFQQWAEQFKTLCHTHHWLDHYSLIDHLAEKIQKNQLRLPKRIILIGFTELSPQQKHFFSVCENQYSEVLHSDFQKTDHIEKKESYISLADEETEIRSMACWAKAILNENKNLPPYSIGCVVPQLENSRETVLQIFSEVFADAHCFSLDYSHLPFNISAGKSLATFPIIHTALKLLQLSKQSISIEELSNILRSPFIGEAEQERTQRAQLDNAIRQSNMSTVSLSELLDCNNKFHAEKYSPKLANRFKQLIHHFDQAKNKMPISAWVDYFIETLTILAWPGERSINSHEYQVVQRWLDLLQEYRTFDCLLPPDNQQNALYYLNRLTSKIIFQPQTNETPIQILGILEAADLPFQHLWIMGLDDNAWPPAAKPNPFIPLRLQKNLQMPHSSAERELIYSRQITNQLKNSANNVIFSHSLKNGDCELRPSSLITYYKKIQLDELKLSPFISYAEHIFKSKKIESIEDEQAPPIQTDEKIQGGASIFKQQAACPFKAFAEIRLHAKPLETPTIGLRAKDRGIMTHKAMEMIWKEINNSQNLHSIHENELHLLLDNIVQEAINTSIGKEMSNLRYISLEAERLKSLLWKWLELEKTRPPFKVISQEQEQSIMIGKIPVQLRVDRIDELDDGSHLIIDYKTGKNNHIKYWFSERPEEPQLPIYCLSNPNAIGIAFAELHPDQLTLKGICKKSVDITTIKPIQDTSYAENKAWDEQIHSWQITLETLSDQFYEGIATVDPKDSIETCQYCELKALCRIHEEILA